MNESPTDAQAELILKEERRRIELERIVGQSRWDYYSPQSIKGWLVVVPPLVGIVYLGQLALNSDDGLVFALIALVGIASAEVNRLEKKLDALANLSKSKQQDSREFDLNPTK